MTNLKRITDANLNRAAEAARILEEIARFLLDDEQLSEKFKYFRHNINNVQEQDYSAYLKARDTENDVGTEIKNKTERKNIENIFKANIKRLQQALRVLGEYSVDNSENASCFEKMRYESYTLEKIMWNKLKEKYNQLKIADKKLYLVTNSDKFESEDAFLDAVASALQGGVDIVQLREKHKNAHQVLELGRKLKLLCEEFGATFIVNDRIDIAAILQADGVHLGQDDLDVKSAREILGDNCIVGISTHQPSDAIKAMEDGADYIGVGPVFATPTKEGRIPVGLDYVKWASENVDIPFFAIGGIDEENVLQVVEAGARKVAVVRAIINAEEPNKAAQKFLEKLGC
jgi:thiamine-phosphate pyrophosphorylase